MNRRLLTAGALSLALTSAALGATPAVTVGTVNLRAGPSTAYPVVTVVPVGTRIVTHGCIAGYTWCDVGVGPARGWMAANWILISQADTTVVLTPAVATAVGIGVVTFGRAYWNSYYVGYPWYRSWAAYGPAPVYRGRVTSHSRDVECADGTCTGSRSTTGWRGGSTSQTRTCSGGSCTATRQTVGPAGGTASRTRSCSRGDASCSLTRTGPNGGSVQRSWSFRN
ncbi:MAG: SH3 domain-containing protein [Hyphomicrobiales bacterium]|nr:SH3 domain-containing protein [Hyphomicrobiales bacterium]